MYDVKFREAAVLVYSYFGSMRKAAKVLKISAASMCRWIKRLEPKGWPPLSSRRAFTETMRTFVRQSLGDDPCVTCMQLQKALLERFDVRVSRQLIGTAIRAMGYSRKRVRSRPSHASAETRRERLHEFRNAIETVISEGRPMVSVDESGFDPRGRSVFYGYAARGQPAVVYGRALVARRVTLLMAVCPNNGVHTSAHRLRTATTNGAAFSEFVRDLPYPPGTAIILDNASIHKTKAIRAIALDKGYQLVFTPPYNPDCNPIENIFGVVKGHFHKAWFSPRTGSEAPPTMERLVSDSLVRVDQPLVDKCFGRMLRLVRSWTDASS